MKNVIFGPDKPVQDRIALPSSKSISNRMLIIKALSGSDMRLINLSQSDDTNVLKQALEENLEVKDVGHAGTAMRFLTAYLATIPGEVVLTGSPRMKERPIAYLAEALRKLGGKISYLEKEGYPPLRISGGSVRGGDIEIKAGISSQFISALMMIGPVLEGGLRMTLSGDVVSPAYIQMTLSLMRQCGVDAFFGGKLIRVPEQPYVLNTLTVESDWSAASYWFQIAALLPGSVLKLPHLHTDSLQGDAILMDLFSALGVESSVDADGLEIRSTSAGLPGRMDYDFVACPDLVQTLAVTLCALEIPFRFTGTTTLRVKETDRIAALETELRKFGYVLNSDAGGEWLEWNGALCTPLADPLVQTYHDHRMAMAFAPLAIVRKRVRIANPAVVSKSYPAYWEDLSKAGFKISFS